MYRVLTTYNDVFFFQAEDGIRDLVRSRGLGDVYKRQKQPVTTLAYAPSGKLLVASSGSTLALLDPDKGEAVSYTHLTLPTSDLV